MLLRPYLKGRCDSFKRITRSAPRFQPRFYSAAEDWRSLPRDTDKADVVIVGAGPAGLAAAIRIKQKCEDTGKDLRVCVLEKASELGMHSLSGAVLEPRSLKELLSADEFQSLQTPDGVLGTPVTKDEIYFLTNGTTGKLPLPVIGEQNNHGNYIISLGNLVRYLGEKAEAMGVEIYPGYPAAEVLENEDGSIKGVATVDMGITKKGVPGPNFQRGLELHAPVTLFGEGCRGSCSQKLMSKFNLRADADHQIYGIGIKEVWEIDPKKHTPGKVVHSIGWPVETSTWGGSFMYQYGKNLVSLGYVLGLDYKNPYTRPYMEFQRLKHHSLFADVLEGGKCISYGARALNEGGYQSIPKLYFPGGALIGCSAGFLNVAKIKGIHTALKSGMLAGESAFNALTAQGYPSLEEEERPALELSEYEATLKKSWLYEELHKVRNIRPAFEKGFPFFIAFSGFQWLVSKGKEPWTWHHSHADHTSLKKASECTKIEYPKPDGVLSFDLLTNLARSGTNHSEDQPAHLTLKDSSVPVKHNLALYDGPEARYCPAGVYEFVEDEANPGQQRLQINAQNCLHCKTCDIKDPTQNIVWTVPEGGGGPAYSGM